MISATVVGNIGKEADVREFGDSKVCNFSVASNARAKVDGEWIEQTTWVRVSLWGQRAASLAQYLTRGKQVAVRGELIMKEYTTKDGDTGKSLELRADDIMLLGGKKNDETTSDTESFDKF